MSGERIRLESGSGRRLHDLLFERGVEFPCGGVSSCGGCKIRVVEGDVAVTAPMREVLSNQETEAGWRLGCMAEASGPVTIEVAQWSARILDDQGEVAFEPAEGLAAVVDVGTTTIVAQLVDRSTGLVLAVKTALNPQGRHGADLMSRIHHEMSAPGEMTGLIRIAVGTMLQELAETQALEEVVLVGNTVMHHFFCGLSVAPLAAVPFRTPWPDLRRLEGGELGWDLKLASPVCFLPCVGGFVGSDLLAGVVATGLHEANELTALLDLGTNGEIAVGDSAGVRCASTAAGPAFEGGRIGAGMRAGAGAIDGVEAVDGGLRCTVLGGIPPRGICGSGLVDAAAAALELGWIEPSGRLARPRKSIPLSGSVQLTQADIRELQLAKAALRAGLDLLLEGRELGADRVYLAGAFGNYVRAPSARRIGLLPEWVLAPRAEGNSALRGARMLLLSPGKRDDILERALSRCTHFELATDPGFQDAFVDNMQFPAQG